MNRRKFLRGLAAVPVAISGAVIGHKALNESHVTLKPAPIEPGPFVNQNYVVHECEEDYVEFSHDGTDKRLKFYSGSQWSPAERDSIRAKSRDILARHMNSKIDTLVFRSLTHG